MKKRGLLVFSLVLTSLFFLSLNFVSADSCSVVTRSTCSSSGGHVVMGLYSSTNAHAELASQSNYNYVLCCDFSGSTTCTGTNKIVGLSSATNAHAEITALTGYNYDVCYGDLSCTDSTSSACPSSYPIATVSLSSITNAHVAQFDYYPEKICCQHSTPAASCGNSIVETGEQCDDGNTNSYDGCSNICQIESGYTNAGGSPSCVYKTDPSADAYWVKLGQSGQFTGGTVGVGDDLTENVPEKICVPNPFPTFKIYKINYFFGINIGSSLIKTIVGTSTSTSLNADWVISTLDAQSLGIGNSDIYFSTTNPNNGNTITGPTITVTITSIMGDGVIQPPEQCDDGNTASGDGCSSNGTIEPGYNCAGQPSVCTLNLCVGVTCPTGQTCNSATGTCVANDLCAGVTCPTNYACDAGTGTCVATDLCAGVTCPTGQVCDTRTGICFSNCTAHATSACDATTGDVYWYDSCGVKEDLKTDCTASQTCSNGQCVSPECSISSASWDKTSATEGDTITLNTGFSNCDGQTISYVIKEKDGIGNPDDPVNVTPSSQTITSGATSISTTWTAEYQDDTDGLETNPPEYYFTATIGSQSKTSSNLVQVTQRDTSYCAINSILSCSNYDQSHCSADICNVAQNSVGSSVQCGKGFDCSCTWDTAASTCVGSATQWTLCGNGVINTGEQCDGNEWGPITGCTDFGYTGGTLNCNGCVFDTSQCTGKTTGVCGNNVVNTGEQCDTTSLPFTNCTRFDSFTSGTLTCNNYCLLNTNSCLGGTTGETAQSKCSYRDISNDTCDDGILERNIVAQWNGTDPQPSWCASYSDQLICPAQIKVSFFGTLQLIIAILLLIIIYYFIKLNIIKNKKNLKSKTEETKEKVHKVSKRKGKK